jgi:hypothetical protein
MRKRTTTANSRICKPADVFDPALSFHQAPAIDMTADFVKAFE